MQDNSNISSFFFCVCERYVTTGHVTRDGQAHPEIGTGEQNRESGREGEHTWLPWQPSISLEKPGTGDSRAIYIKQSPAWR